MPPTRVVLLAGRRRSLASLLMLTALTRLRTRNIEVAAVLCVSEFNWSRVWDWYLRFGVTAFRKALREAGWKNNADDEERAMLQQRIEEWSVTARSLPELCRQEQIPFHIVPEINGSQALSKIAVAKADLGIYSGAGILRKSLLDQFPRGVLNLHCGMLPAIRGMNGVEWTLYHGHPPEVTLHYIDPGIDTGRILASKWIPKEPRDSLALLRGKTIVAGIDLLAENLPALERLSARENPLEEGRQYFAMAQTLKRVLDYRLQCPSTAKQPAENLERSWPSQRAA